MHCEYETSGTCAQMIDFDLEDDVVRNIRFFGGCNGNLKALSILLEGSTVEYIEEKLRGNSCGGRPTSCADQLAIAVRQAYDAQKGIA